MKTKPLDASAGPIASPERAMRLLNKVIASGGIVNAVEQAVGVVQALERDFSVRARAVPGGSRSSGWAAK